MRRSSSKNKRRIFHLLIFFILGWSLILSRLFVIQISHTRDFSSHHINLIDNSVQQRKQEFVLSLGRGNIYDRNLNSLIEQKEMQTVIAFPFIKDIIDRDKIQQLADIIDMKQEEVLKQIKELSNPSYIQEKGHPIEINNEQQRAIEELHILGIIATTYTLQDVQANSAKHVIGYLGQAPDVIKAMYQEYMDRGILKRSSLIGRSGLQMTFQELLMGIGESKIGYFVDNIGRPLNGLSYKYSNQ